MIEPTGVIRCIAARLLSGTAKRRGRGCGTNALYWHMQLSVPIKQSLALCDDRALV